MELERALEARWRTTFEEDEALLTNRTVAARDGEVGAEIAAMGLFRMSQYYIYFIKTVNMK